MNVLKKDSDKLLKLVNLPLADYHARIAIYNLSENLLNFYSSNASSINAKKVVVVRNSDDFSYAAHVRNTCDKVLFLFGENYHVDSYLSDVCFRVELPKALIKRVSSI
ncbi:hypothetical protein FQP81_18380 [Pseudoalteromonas distincta]|uniref:hypothetical protein n=1 Tax=Pseudoalteromonas TaxID=53246 RepID=UPI000C32AD9B|nr:MULTISPECIES: hypothetical protein [Pseudoalteromonas]PKG68644.1 hypothetical protein CXF64_20190 [Pseudoalteromonas sp. GutCa3]TVU70424.1 hypothetical protein FQP81_18380 [Pseudoalteromonas elyakovii]